MTSLPWDSDRRLTAEQAARLGRAAFGVIDWADAHTTARCVDFAGVFYAGGAEAAACAYSTYGVDPSGSEWDWLGHRAVAMGIEDVYYGTGVAQPRRVKAALGRLRTLLR